MQNKPVHSRQEYIFSHGAHPAGYPRERAHQGQDMRVIGSRREQGRPFVTNACAAHDAAGAIVRRADHETTHCGRCFRALSRVAAQSAEGGSSHSRYCHHSLRRPAEKMGTRMRCHAYNTLQCRLRMRRRARMTSGINYAPGTILQRQISAIFRKLGKV